MYIYLYVYIYMYIYLYVCIYIYMYIHICIFIYIYICIYIYTYMHGYSTRHAHESSGSRALRIVRHGEGHFSPFVRPVLAVHSAKNGDEPTQTKPVL